MDDYSLTHSGGSLLISMSRVRAKFIACSNLSVVIRRTKTSLDLMFL